MILGIAALAAAAACGDDSVSSDVGAGTEQATQDDDGNSDGGTTTESDDDGVSLDETGAADSTGEQAGDPLPYARDIRLTRITANQGVQVTLVEDGIEVPGEDYNTHVIVGRRTLVRGFWTLHADFEPRELIGRLTIDYEDGTQTEQDYTVMVDGESGDGGASMQWLLEPDEMVPGMRFRARLLEPDPSYEGGEVASPPPIAPLPGTGGIDIYDVPLQLRVLLVPVQHEFEGCTMTVEPTEQDIQDMAEQLEQSNPVQTAEVIVGDPMVFTDAIGSGGQGFSGVLGALAEHRAAIAPADNVYIYGLLDPCDGFPPGLLGQAIGIPGEPLPELANQRISTGRWRGTGLETSETFVHEVGHTQGRRHVFCSGGEAGADPAYPHAGGRIGVWGFGIYDFQLRTPTGARDYMTYCSNEWVSDYAWEQTLSVIEVLSSWDNEAPPAEHPLMLMGTVDADGGTRWWTTRGDLDPTLLPSPHQISLSIDGAEVWMDATTQLQPDGTATTVMARLPVDWEAASEIALAGPEIAVAIAPESITRAPARR